MEILADVAAWFADPTHWQGSDGVPVRVLEHLRLSALSLFAGALVALPAGLFVGHTGRGALLAVNVANVGQAMPSFAILALAFPLTLRAGLGLGFWAPFVALVVLSIPPMLVNTYVAVNQVDRDMVEAARGLGMREREVLLRVELPVALRVILGGVRTAAVFVVATATLGAVVAGGGLGRYIIDGFATQELDKVVAGALLVALLAIGTELFFAHLQRRLVSPGLGDTRPAGQRG